MPPDRPPNGTAPDEERILDSWKEIASYLGRAVRTVQTWEKREGLPVHRHQHRRGGTVYAYPAEIDAWKLGRDDFEHEAADEPEPSRSGRWWIAVAAVLALVAAVGWLWTSGSSEPARGRELSLDEGSALLIAGFANETGEEVLDGTLETALERDLAGQGFVELVSRERLGDSLRLIGEATDTTLDTDLAREIALRDTDIQAVLIGRIERSGSTYVLHLEVMNPLDGTVVARWTEEAAGQGEILPAVGRLSQRIRENLGEGAPVGGAERGSKRLSAPSLRALQLYSRADRVFVEENLGGTRRNEVAEALLREAIAEDPDFAVAHMHLAWAIRRQWRPSDEYLPHAAQALELLDGATVAERYFIRGSYSHMRSMSSGARSDQEEALAQYQALLELDSDHFWAIINSFDLLENLGRSQETLELSLRALDARPNDSVAISRVAERLVAIKGDLEEARTYIERARRLRNQLPPETRPADPFLEFFPVHELWVQGEVEKVVEEIETIVESVGSLAAAERKSLAQTAIGYYLDLGMLERARQLQELYSVLPRRAFEFKMAWRRREWDVVRELNLWRAASGQVDVLTLVAADLALGGYADESEELLEQLPPQYDFLRGLVATARGVIALDRDRYQEAVLELEGAVDSLRYGRGTMGYYFSSGQRLSRALEALGRPERAVEVLEEASRQKPRVLGGRFAWLETRLRLADFYRATGREAEVLAIEDELRRYCAFSDPDYFILRELQRREP